MRDDPVLYLVIFMQMSAGILGLIYMVHMGFKDVAAVIAEILRRRRLKQLAK
jgi:hypothetical protein